MLPCDIFFTRSQTLLGKLIRACTRSHGEPRTWAQHVGLIVEAGEGREAVAVEALATVKRHPLKDEYGEETQIVAFRPLNLTPQEKKLILDAAENYVGKHYGYAKLLLHFLDWCIGRNVFRRLAKVDKFPICSYLVAHCFKAAGKNFGIKEDAASPDDLWDFVRANPDKYQEVE